MHRLSERFGAGYLAGAAALLLFAVLSLLLLTQVQSDRVLWTGQPVLGQERNGLVLYRWHGEGYSLDVPGYGNRDRFPLVIDPANPSYAVPDRLTDRITDGLLTALPAALAVGLLIAGANRRRIRAFRHRRAGESPRTGLDDDVVQRLLAERRRKAAQPPA